MSASYPLMFGFGFVLLASWAGWGAALERLVLRRASADRALHAGWGLAWTCVVGGVLNLAEVVSPAANGLFLATGVFLLFGDAWLRRGRVRSSGRRGRTRRRIPRGLIVAWLVVAAMLLSAYAASVCSKTFNGHDDLQAYLVYPAKMVETGAMGPDPYSERRVVSLGAMSYLHALILGVADFRYVYLIDPGVSLLLVVGLLVGVARDARAPRWVAALAALLFLVVPVPWANVTSLVSGLALFLVLFRTLSGVALRGSTGARGAVLVALTAAALCSLKSTFVVPCALTVVGASVLKGLNRRERRAALRGLAVVGVLTPLLLAPWMVSLYQSSGTLLYPFLGRGFHGSAYAGYWRVQEGVTWPAATEALIGSLTDLAVLPAWILGLGLLLQRRWGAARGAALPFIAAALASYVAMATVHPIPAYRYSWPSLSAAILALVVYSLAPVRGLRPGWPLVRAAAPALIAVSTLVVAHSELAWRLWRNKPRVIEAGLAHARSQGLKRGARGPYLRMQRSVPKGAAILTRLRYPFLLKFTRNTVFIADLPGGASPPRGMPFFEGPERLAGYLCAQGIEYVAYAYCREAGFPRRAFAHRLRPDAHPWHRAQAEHTLDFQANLTELGYSRYRVYDDGDRFVLDLGTTWDGVPLGCAPSRDGP